MGHGSGLDRHELAVAALRERYAALPAGSPVRLAKSTSNLFRFREPTRAPGLDVRGFGDVLRVDVSGRSADVGGMTTYERLVGATLPCGLMPLVVPQLKTITLGGAVAGLGIESSSYRNGLPHESVIEAEILTGDGRVVVARPDNEHADLFWGFPNSYGTLGYALRVRIELEPVTPFVRLRHVRCSDAAEAASVVAAVCGTGGYAGEPVDFVDGTVFGPRETYVTVANLTADAPAATSDYTGMNIFYRSIPMKETDYLTIGDYLWRWDTDWFWCSQALGAQHPVVRRLWPKRYLRSDVYRRVVAFDRRYGISDRARRMLRLAPREMVIQDVEVPIDRLAEFLDFFHRDIGISPIWLCPLKIRSATAWPLYPLRPGVLYVNVGFWSSVARRPGEPDGTYNRELERVVTELGGHKSLYSTSYYSREEFWRRYNGDAYQRLKHTYDPAGRLPDLYAKCVRGR